LPLVLSDTPVNRGIIRSDTSWGASGSPYMIMGKVQVAPNVTLTISPRTTVVFSNDDSQLAVYGILQAKQTTFLNKTKNSNYWETSKGINFTSTDLSRSYLVDCIVRNGSLSVSSSCGKLRVVNTTFNVRLTTDSQFCETGFLFTNCTFGDDSAYGNEGSGRNTREITIFSNTFFNRGSRLLINSGSNITVYNSNITNSTIISFGYSYLGLVNSNVSGSNIFAYYAYSQFSLLRSKFVGNNIDFSYSAVNASWCSFVGCNLKLGNGNISWSVISPSQNQDRVGLDVYSSSGACDGIILSRTNITNFKTGISFSGQPCQYTKFNISRCNIDNEMNVVVKFPNNITATNNYWGTTQYNVIEDSMDDGHLDLENGYVNFSPWSNNPWPVPRPPVQKKAVPRRHK